MAIQAPSRPVRTIGGQFSKRKGQQEKGSSHSTNNKAPASHHQQPQPLTSFTTIPNSSSTVSDDIDEIDEPQAKRRKLSIRGKHHQTTLDHFTSQSGHGQPAKPPTKVHLAQPHGQLLQTVNGVHSVLDVDADELSLPNSRNATPKPSRLPLPPTKQEDKRTLRSQDDGPRLKSELAIYFPNYEDVIFDVTREEEEFLTMETAIYIVDDTPKSSKVEQAGKSPKTTLRIRHSSTNGVQSPSARHGTLDQHNGSPTLQNLDMISRTLPSLPTDPLSDAHYLKSHRRAERKEKQLRNIEKERAMHEKVQLDRLLDGLQGHDWLKVLGITGITDGEAKKYEAKRDYFISEVQTLVDKFRLWKEQERRQRLARSEALREEEEEEEEEEESVEDDGSVESDLNASAARQLQQETAAAGVVRKKSGITIKLSRRKRDPLPFAPPPSPGPPISSFYAKRHLRDAALGKARHAGRNVTAFGHALPDMEEREFELPEDLAIDKEELLRVNARERRARKRRSVADAEAAAGG